LNLTGKSKANCLDLIVIALLLLLTSSHAIASRDFDKIKLDRFLTMLVDDDLAMLSVAINEKGKLTYMNQTGYSQLSERWFLPDTKTLATSDTRYKIASISKSFTAVLVFQLIEQGKLSLSTRLSEYYPEVPNANSITIEQLLSHWSGIFNYTNAANLEANCRQDYTPDEMVEIIASHRPSLPPGAHKEYSNSNYVLLAGIIEQVTGKKYDELLESNIIQKAKLTQTSFCGTVPCQGYSDSYYLENGQWSKSLDCSHTYVRGSGSMISTAKDLTLFANALFNDELVSEESFRAMKGFSKQHGKGLSQIPFHYRNMYGHMGAIDGFRSVYGYFEDDDVSIALILNGNATNHHTVLVGILDIYYGRPFEIEDFNRH